MSAQFQESYTYLTVLTRAPFTSFVQGPCSHLDAKDPGKRVPGTCAIQVGGGLPQPGRWDAGAAGRNQGTEQETEAWTAAWLPTGLASRQGSAWSWVLTFALLWSRLKRFSGTLVLVILQATPLGFGSLQKIEI